ncbi:MAG: Rrf2 family transcriptional regulator [Candidatus Omnitrophica bacterium CG12_big_fil_rev_8_21_14_0_65_50_5]|nr:MAG: Rrf2 family transcriptional regulator [Candidatus Omnitrophica bacterium CG12_big_fil_rev_8_21_14_0_65_50_5]
MFKINRKIEYALISLKHMSCKKPDALTSAKEICDVYRTPFDPTSRVLQIMAQHKVLHAEQGVKGGYRIMRDLNKLKLLELSDMIVGPIEIAGCFHGNYSHCGINSVCQIISPMLNLNDQIREVFGDMSVVYLLKARHQSEKVIQRKEFKQATEAASV